jgi:hypothetical protein
MIHEKRKVIKMEELVFTELDKRIGEDFIQSVTEVRNMFNLTVEEFYIIYKKWAVSS